MLDQLLGYFMDAARWLIIVVLTVIYPEHYTPWQGRVLEAVRPDEVKVMRGPDILNVRIYGVDCPLAVRGQAFGKEAREYTERRLLGKIITVQQIPANVKGPWYEPKIIHEDDLRWEGNARKYTRVIGLVSVDGKSYGEELLRQGIGRWYRPFVPFERGIQTPGGQREGCPAWIMGR